MRTHVEPTLDGIGPFLMPGPELCVVDREVDGVTVIDLIGPLVRELPVHTFRDQIQELLDEGTKNLAINLAEVSYADSCGVGSLVTAYNLVRQAGGRIKFFAATTRLVHTFARLRLDTVFDLYEDEASAVSSF